MRVLSDAWLNCNVATIDVRITHLPVFLPWWSRRLVLMAGSVTLRPSTPEDRGFLLAIYASTRDEELSLSGWDDNQKRAFIAMQFHAQSQQDGLCYPQADSSVILLNDHPLGRL